MNEKTYIAVGKMVSNSPQGMKVKVSEKVLDLEPAEAVTYVTLRFGRPMDEVLEQLRKRYSFITADALKKMTNRLVKRGLIVIWDESVWNRIVPYRKGEVVKEQNGMILMRSEIGEYLVEKVNCAVWYMADGTSTLSDIKSVMESVENFSSELTISEWIFRSITTLVALSLLDIDLLQGDLT